MCSCYTMKTREKAGYQPSRSFNQKVSETFVSLVHSHKSVPLSCGQCQSLSSWAPRLAHKTESPCENNRHFVFINWCLLKFLIVVYSWLLIRKRSLMSKLMVRSCDVMWWSHAYFVPTEDEYLTGILRVRVTSATNLKVKQGWCINKCKY